MTTPVIMPDYSTPTQTLALGESNTEFSKFLEQNTFPDVSFADVPKMRKEMQAMNAAKGVNNHSGSLHVFQARDGHKCEFLLFQPPDTTSAGPLVVLVYGGGFITGEKVDMVGLAQDIRTKFRATVVCPEYRLAPEFKFPTAPNDLWDFMLWLADNIAVTQANPKAGFIIGGVSAGANLAAVIASKAMAPNYPLNPTAVYLGFPVLFSEGTVPAEYKDVFLSREQNAKAPILNGEAMRLIEGYYAMDYSSPDFCPVFAPSGIRGHPKTYLQVAGLDPLRDDGIIYERILRSEGVLTKMDVYPGLPHCFNSVLPFLEASHEANEDLINGIGWLFEKS